MCVNFLSQNVYYNRRLQFYLGVGMKRKVPAAPDRGARRTDNLSRRDRSALMSRVRGKDTAPELRVRRVVHKLGFRFSLHRKDLAGSPDIVFSKYRAVIFVHGCFWHRHQNCRKATTPRTRAEFWTEKFERNVIRDAAARKMLKRDGWKIMTIWECQVAKEAKLKRRIKNFLSGRF